MSDQKIERFRKKILDWSEKNPRPLPWKGEKNPYLIWLSEIILQQTRVEQGWTYYERFRTQYPQVEKLAAASGDEIMKQWEGLGYYSRARNMHTAAKYIKEELAGIFPDTYAGIRSLKGVGPYTAAAIASFAYDLPYAVLDGNVFRVLARIYGIDTPIDSTVGKRQFGELAQDLLDPKQAGRYNQAIMDFGAIHCTPRNPSCDNCPFRPDCQARQSGQVLNLPVKGKKIKKKTRYFHYLILNFEGQLILQKREERDIWRNLYEFPMIESSELHRSEAELVKSKLWQEMIGNCPFRLEAISPSFRQLLTHQKIIANFWEIQIEEAPENSDSFLIIERKNLRKFAFPKIIDLYLRDNSLYLKLL
ncbi:MAG: A/G-specific adenine glycosylase [Saprospiraceae bacterium]|nr:MAG: A/G-specific adenine glycosylase [Saprospiraceae bacterium]